jgi:hypothetical protein
MSALQRWEGFLKQIADRHASVCQEARDGAKEALAAADHDPTPVAHAWAAVTNRLIELERKIIDTWNEKVDDTFEAEGFDPKRRAAEREKGATLAWELENQRQAVEMGVFAWGAREMHAKALAQQPERNCPHCGAPLNVPVSYRSLNLTCAHCRTVVTFEPGALARIAVAFGAHALAWEAAQAEWLGMRTTERRVRDTRPPVPLALLKDHERAQIAYWFKYMKARAHFEPELRDVAYEVRCRMEHWYTMSAEHEEEWVRAGRPKEPI